MIDHALTGCTSSGVMTTLMYLSLGKDLHLFGDLGDLGDSVTIMSIEV